MAGVQRRRQGKRSNEAAAVQKSSSGGDRIPWRRILVAFFIVPLAMLLIWRFTPRATGDLSYKQILQEAKPARMTSNRNLKSMVLAYVTPWNSKGYDMAKTYGNKFTHVSPVWYQLRRNDRSLSLTGRHDVDQNWISDVRKQGSPLIVPRIVLEGWPLINMLVDSEEKRQAINLIVDECKAMGFDGVVLESWTAWSSHKFFEKQELRQKALEFVRDLGSALHSSSKQLLLVIPPYRGGTLQEFRQDDMSFLKDSVDAFSLMTYDFSSAYRPGPNAPLPWIRSCIHTLLAAGDLPRSKVLLGINFYGNDFILPQGGGPILGDQFLKLLEHHKPELEWDVENHEHYFEYTQEKQRHRVYYPTLRSLGLRLNESRASGLGVSIWEIGQGLEPFFNIL